MVVTRRTSLSPGFQPAVRSQARTSRRPPRERRYVRISEEEQITILEVELKVLKRLRDDDASRLTLRNSRFRKVVRTVEGNWLLKLLFPANLLCELRELADGKPVLILRE